MRKLAACLLALALAASVPARAADQLEDQAGNAGEDDLLVLQLRLGKARLGSDLTALTRGDRLFLPLGQLAQLLEIGIATDPGRGMAAGFLHDGTRRFLLDAAAARVALGEESQGLDPGSVRVEPDDIYVDSELLARWLPVDFELVFQDLTLDLHPRGELPIQARIAREKRQAELGLRNGGSEGPVLPRHEEPYRLLSAPFADVSASTGLDWPVDGGPAANADWSALVSGDLLWMNGQLNLAGQREEPLSSARLRLGRRDPFGRLLGPVGATEFALGDIVTAPLALVATSSADRGVAVSSFPLEQATEVDRTTIVGELPLGWQVELYRDEVLLDFRASGRDGRLVFEDVPLLYGLNTFRLVFYGPQGQRREETRRIFTGPGLLGKGRHYWRAGLSQANERLMGLDEDSESEDDVQGKPRFTAEYATGLSETIAIRAGVGSLPLADAGRGNFVTASSSAALRAIYTTLAVAADQAGGTALQVTGQTRALGTSILAEHTQYLGFTSEQDSDLDSRTRLRVDGSLDVVRLGYGLQLEHERTKDGETESELSSRLSTRLGRAAISNTLKIDLGQGEDGGEREVEGTFLLSGRVGPVHLRGGIDYDLAPAAALATTVLGADWYLSETLGADAALSHDWEGDDGTKLELGLNKHFDRVALGLTAEAGTTGEAAVGLNLSFSFGREPRRRSWIVSSDGLATSAAASARVFLDQNGDGRFGPGDRALEGVELQSEGFSRRRAVTDKEGVALLTGIPADRPARITVVSGTLEDPYMIPVQEGVEAVLHPAATGLLEFPVVMTGEVEGWVRREDGTPVRGREVQLVDQAGHGIARTRTDYEGYYYLEKVRPGRWRVAVADVPGSVRDLTISPDGNVLTIDLSVSADPEPAAAPRPAQSS